MTAAVFWRELERRANLTGEHLATYFPNLDNNNRRALIVSHSLGCFASATALKTFALQSANVIPFNIWLCMAGALPANAFTESGFFKESLDVVALPVRSSRSSAIGVDFPRLGTFALFSYFDLVLGTAYVFANSTLALGQTGALIPVKHVENINVTDLAGETHTISNGYFQKVGALLRAIFRTNGKEQDDLRQTAQLRGDMVEY